MVSVNLKDEKFNPFPGLRPYAPEEHGYFFGRANESAEITGKLLRNRTVAVTGASGSGKSSLVYCGVLPELIKRTSAEDPEWVFLNMKPGNDPYGNLTSAFVKNIVNIDQLNDFRNDIYTKLKEEKDGIRSVIEKMPLTAGSRVLLFIDQFEELFRYGTPEAGKGTGQDTGAFLELLTNAVKDQKISFYLIIAIRSDLLTACEPFRGFTELLNNSNFLVSGLNRENFREIITGPIINAGATIEEDLVELILNEISERSDQLPVLQHAMMRTWAHWQEMNEPERPVDYSDYSSAGTVKHSISGHADEIYGELSEEEKRICQRLFRIITARGSDNRGFRYPSKIKTLTEAIQCERNNLIGVIEEFRDPSVSFLAPHYSVALTDESIIDLSHESLIHLWERLKTWVDEESQSVQMYLRISEASALYHHGKTGLLRQPDLQLAINWRNENKPNLAWAAKYDPAFERAMVYLRTSEAAFHEEEERKSRHNRWKLHRIRIVSSILGGLALIAALTMIGAFISKFSSDSKRRTAEKQQEELTVQKSLAEEYAALAIKKSIESDSGAIAASRREQMERMMRRNAENQYLFSQKEIEETRNEFDSAIRAGRLAMMSADSANKMKEEFRRLRLVSVARSLSLRSLQVDNESDLKPLFAYQAYLFNTRNSGSRNDADIYHGLYSLAKSRGSQRIRSFDPEGAQVRSILFLPGTNEFLTSDAQGKVTKWDLSDDGKNYSLIYTGNGPIDVMAVSPDAGWLACAEQTNSIRMIPLGGNSEEYLLTGHSGKIRSLLFSYDGKSLYSAALDGRVLKWDLTARTSVDITTGKTFITSIDITTDNRTLAGISDRGEGFVWNTGGKETGFTIASKGRKINSIRFHPGGDQLAVGYDDGLMELWDIPRMEKIAEFRAHDGEVTNIRFNSRSPQLATTGKDGTLKLWDTDDFKSNPVSLTDNGEAIEALAYSPDGETIFAGNNTGKPKILARPAYADSFAADGCTYVTRNFTPDEWLAYVGKDIEYERTCPESDFKIKIREVR